MPVAKQCLPCRKSEPEITLRACTRCKSTSYCSTACQRADFKMHKDWCKAKAQVRAEWEAAGKAIPVDRRPTEDEKFEEDCRILQIMFPDCNHVINDKPLEYDDDDATKNPHHPDFTDYKGLAQRSRDNVIGIMGGHADAVVQTKINADGTTTLTYRAHYDPYSRPAHQEQYTYDEPYYEYPDPI